MIAKELSDYLHRNFNSNVARQRHWFDIRLVGAIRGMDPTPIVYEWLQTLSKTWIIDNEGDHELPKQLYNNDNRSCTLNGFDHTSVTDSLNVTTATVSNTTTLDGFSCVNAVLRIVSHVRVPEDFTCQR